MKKIVTIGVITWIILLSFLTPANALAEPNIQSTSLPTVAEIIGNFDLSSAVIQDWISSGLTERTAVATFTVYLAKNHQELGLVYDSPLPYVALAEQIWMIYRADLISQNTLLNEVLAAIPTEPIVLSAKEQPSLALTMATRYQGLVNILNQHVTDTLREIQLASYQAQNDSPDANAFIAAYMTDFILKTFPQIGDIADLNQMIQLSVATGVPTHIPTTDYYLGGDGFFLPNNDGPMFDCTGLVSRMLEGMFGLEEGSMAEYATSHWLMAIDTKTMTAQLGDLEFSVRQLESIRNEFFDEAGTLKTDLHYQPGTVIIFATPGVMNHALVVVSLANVAPVFMETSKSLLGTTIHTGTASVNRIVNFLNDDLYHQDGQKIYIFSPVS